MRRAEWEYARGQPTGEMTGIDERSLYRVAGDDYEEAFEAMARPPHRWGEWVAVFHPRFEGQIVGYTRLRPTDWFCVPEGGSIENVEGPFPTKKLILSKLRQTTSEKVRTSVYRAAGHLIFTRAVADSLIEGATAALP